MPQDIAIHCTLAADRPIEVAIHPRRLLPIGRLLSGKTPEQAMRVFSLLFSLCRHAQCSAAAQAMEQAMGIIVAPVIQQSRHLLGELEMLKEHCLNLLLHQPDIKLGQNLLAIQLELTQALGGENVYQVGVENLAQDWQQWSSGLQRLRALLQSLFGEWYALAQSDLADTLAWANRDPSPAAQLVRRYLSPELAGFGNCRILALPLLADEQVRQTLVSDAAGFFLQQPRWQGAAYETSSYTRQADTPLIQAARTRYGNGLLTRTLARLVEIKALFLNLQQPAAVVTPPPSPYPAEGLAQLEASRGRLIHRVVLRAGNISQYQILAPTEWNFHPQGLVYQALQDLTVLDAEHAKAAINALLSVIDPCVDFRLTLAHA